MEENSTKPFSLQDSWTLDALVWDVANLTDHHRRREGLGPNPTLYWRNSNAVWRNSDSTLIKPVTDTLSDPDGLHPHAAVVHASGLMSVRPKSLASILRF